MIKENIKPGCVLSTADDSDYQISHKVGDDTLTISVVKGYLVIPIGYLTKKELTWFDSALRKQLFDRPSLIKAVVVWDTHGPRIEFSVKRLKSKISEFNELHEDDQEEILSNYIDNKLFIGSEQEAYS